MQFSSSFSQNKDNNSTIESFTKAMQLETYRGNPCNINPLSANPMKWPNTLKQFVGNLPMNCFSVFGHFVNLN